MNSAFAANLKWTATTSIVGASSEHLLEFTSASGNSQLSWLSGRAQDVGNHQLLLTVSEPGASYPMDTVTVVIQAIDSNAPVQVEDEAEGSMMDALTESTMLQAALAGLVLFVLMGTLMIRGQSRSLRDQERRMERAVEIRQSRGLTDLPSRELIQQPHLPRPRERSSSMFDDFKRSR